MKKKLFVCLLIVSVVFFVTGVCVAAKGKDKGESSTNKQSLETSTRGKERAEQRHQMREERELGREDDGANDDKDKKKEKKDKKKSQGDKNKKVDKEGDEDGVKEKDSNDIKASASEEKAQDENKSRRWWEFYKKSE